MSKGLGKPMQVGRVVVQSKAPVELNPTNCRHCAKPLQGLADEGFCCRGCAAAYSLIHTLGLTQYYSLRRRESIAHRPVTNDYSEENWQIFDNSEFQQGFVTYDSANLGRARVQVSPLACYACIWLCEKIVAKLSPAAAIDLNFGQGSGLITFDPKQIQLSKIVAALAQCGYSVQAAEASAAAWTPDILRLGVGAFCSLNIMTFAFADYLSQAGEMPLALWHLFRYLSLALCSVCFLYCGAPLLRNAAIALRQRRPHIDLPIIVTLLVVYACSFVHTLLGKGEVYFDSIAVIITLLLLGRWVQKGAIAQAEKAIATYGYPEREFVTKLGTDGQEVLVHVRDIKRGDYLRLFPGSLVPVNCILREGHGEVNFESITGESHFVEVGPKQVIRAGGALGAAPLVVEALQDGAHSYLIKLQDLASRLGAGRSSWLTLSSRLAFWFLIVIGLFATAALVIYWADSPQVAIARTIAVLLVACPCAFGMSGPLIFASCIGRAMQEGIAFRSPQAIEDLAAVKAFAFDKTGTLTRGRPLVVKTQLWHSELAGLGLNLEQLASLLAPCLKVSQHHACLALGEWVEELLESSQTAVALPAFSSGIEKVGQGIAYICQGLTVKVGRYAYCLPDHKSAKAEPPASCADANLFVTIADRLVGAFWLQDTTRAHAKECVATLREAGCEVLLISGDQGASTLAIAEQLNIHAENVSYELSPSQKILRMGGVEGKWAMVGNGLNDTLALAKAEVGIAVHDATPQARKIANVCLAYADSLLVPRALAYSRAAITRIKQSLLFAGIYNLGSILCALSGFINPFVAAIIMPLNSLIIIYLALKWQVKGEPFRGSPIRAYPR